ncbi:MAG: hypothetical protein MI867_17040 [Pseudomonadales bacterium]|nr:hypothetical protein [Pseudomonadales bacterium]
MKFFKVIFGALALLFVIWLGFGMIWWQSNHDEVLQAVDQAMLEGETIGKDSSDAECLQTYLDIMRDCREMTCSIQNQVFLKACLEHSRATGTLCAQTPSQSELIQLAKWASKLCLDSNIQNSHCAAGLQEVAIYCSASTLGP